MIRSIKFIIYPKTIIRNFFSDKSKEAKIMFIKKKKGSSEKSVEARVAAIKALGKPDEPKKRRKAEDEASNLAKLLNCLYDEAPECRIAAAQELGKTSEDVAFTYISHIMINEKDENVIEAMKAALVSIRENMRIEHSARA